MVIPIKHEAYKVTCQNCGWSASVILTKGKFARTLKKVNRKLDEEFGDENDYQDGYALTEMPKKCPKCQGKIGKEKLALQ